jgi:outer membrane lipoprotein
MTNSIFARKRYVLGLFPVLILLLGSCASSSVPQPIREPPARAVSVSQVQREPNYFLGHRVRWGGSILAVRNRQRSTEIEILSRPLGIRGEPRETESGDGRFIALLARFADPADYPEQRLLTVVGRVESVQTRLIGQYPYPYPVVAVEQSHLWPKPLPPPPPYYYPDPWYYPWYRPWYW